LDTYFTIAVPSEGEYKEKGSKFIAFTYFVSDESSIKEKLEQLKKEHFKATHHCYAYRLGIDGKNYRANDDGEPSGTAGRPILGQIDSFGLTNVLIIVVRYYGGTKLGTSGLINAYREAAKNALEKSQKIEKIIESIVEVSISYNQLNEMMQFLKQYEIEIITSIYTDNEILVKLNVRNKLIAIVNEKISNWCKT
jgi:uncharacterized YigZ family protein